METSVIDEVLRPVKELHTYHRTVFLGTAYIQQRLLMRWVIIMHKVVFKGSAAPLALLFTLVSMSFLQ